LKLSSITFFDESPMTTSCVIVN